MIKQLIIWGSLFVLLIVCMGFYSLPSVNDLWFTKNLVNNSIVIKTVLSVFILFFVAYFIVVGIILKKYSLKIEQLSFGGVNVLFNNSDKIYIKTVMNYLDTKRTLFKILPQYDSFEETLNSYFETYSFIRSEMKILNAKHDKQLYTLSNEILKVLNKFLTEHQNNYRRWHKYVAEHDKVSIGELNENNDEVFLSYHLTPIGKIQKHYYHYNKLLSDIQDVNKFFMEKVKPTFNIDVDKWSW